MKGTFDKWGDENVFIIIASDNWQRCEKKVQALGLIEVLHYKKWFHLYHFLPPKHYFDVQLGHTFKLEAEKHLGIKCFTNGDEQPAKIHIQDSYYQEKRDCSSFL